MYLLRKVENRVENSEGRLRKSERARITLKQQLEQALVFSKQLISDQECLLRQLAERAHESPSHHHLPDKMEALRAKLKVTIPLIPTRKHGCKHKKGTIVILLLSFILILPTTFSLIIKLSKIVKQ